MQKVCFVIIPLSFRCYAILVNIYRILLKAEKKNLIPLSAFLVVLLLFFFFTYSHENYSAIRKQ